MTARAKRGKLRKDKGRQQKADKLMQTKKGSSAEDPFYCGVKDGARTHDPWNHNPML